MTTCPARNADTANACTVCIWVYVFIVTVGRKKVYTGSCVTVAYI